MAVVRQDSMVTPQPVHLLNPGKSYSKLLRFWVLSHLILDISPWPSTQNGHPRKDKQCWVLPVYPNSLDTSTIMTCFEYFISCYQKKKKERERERFNYGLGPCLSWLFQGWESEDQVRRSSAPLAITPLEILWLLILRMALASKSLFTELRCYSLCLLTEEYWLHFFDARFLKLFNVWSMYNL